MAAIRGALGGTRRRAVFQGPEEDGCGKYFEHIQCPCFVAFGPCGGVNSVPHKFLSTQHLRVWSYLGKGSLQM